MFQESFVSIRSVDRVGLAAEFIRARLHLDPKEQLSATDLVAHPWLKDAFMFIQGEYTVD